jgi:octaprenyl-diphosphate synthase
MSTIDKIKAPINDELKGFEAYFKEAVKGNIKLLNIINDYIFRHKGKQMRPMFVFLMAKLNGQITESTYNAATFIELLHTATLVHDDVVDDANERRGFLSINALWRSKIAVLVGDYWLSRGLLLATEREEYKLLQIVAKAVKAMSEGELLQWEKSRKLDITESVYYDIIRQKTATLIAASSASGAYSAGVSQEQVDRMWQFGEFIGMAFQIKDDILDYDQNSAIGKPTGNDIKEKKITLPLIYTLNQLSLSEQKQILKTIRKHHDNQSKVKEIIELVRKTGGLEYAEERMNFYKKSALDMLIDFPESDIKESVKLFVDYTVSRKK